MVCAYCFKSKSRKICSILTHLHVSLCLLKLFHNFPICTCSISRIRVTIPKIPIFNTGNFQLLIRKDHIVTIITTFSFIVFPLFSRSGALLCLLLVGHGQLLEAGPLLDLHVRREAVLYTQT